MYQRRFIVDVLTPKSKVWEMERMGVRAISLDMNTVRVARAQGRDVLKEVQQCLWSVIILSPERLTSRPFDNILRNATFRSNLILYVIDEAHVIGPWGQDF